MQSLLSASENSIVQSFLSVMNYPDQKTLTAREWALLAPAAPLDSLVDNPDHKEALAKATKDLMTLEPERWRLHSAMQDPSRSLHHHTMLHHRRQQSTFSFPQGKLQLDPQLVHMNDIKSSSSSSPHLCPSPTGNDRQQIALLQSSHQLMDPPPHGHIGSPMRKHASSTSELHPPSTSSSSTPSSSSSQSASKHTSKSSSAKRNRASSSASPTSSVTPSTTPTQKQILLSPSQKKANHIQSEQKRRANIRRGYEALCENVPALREAIKQEEEEAAMVAEKMNSGSGRRRRKKGQGKDGINGEKEKVDGRAGPRSENVVLTKSTSSNRSVIHIYILSVRSNRTYTKSAV